MMWQEVYRLRDGYLGTCAFTNSAGTGAAPGTYSPFGLLKLLFCVHYVLAPPHAKNKDVWCSGLNVVCM